MESIWEKTVEFEPRGALNKNLKTEAAVIGGGLSGVLTAYFLQQAGKKVVLLEAGRIGSGQTKGTTAKITSQHGLFYSKMYDKLGKEILLQYAQANEEAVGKYRSLIQSEQIDCDFVECPAYLYTQEEAGELQKEAETARKLGIKASFTTQTELPFSVSGAVRFDGQARFHPLRFLKEVSKSLTIYENTRVQAVEGNCIRTECGKVEAEDIVLAGHYPFILTPGYYFLRMHQERSYALALQTERKPMEGMYLGIDKGGLSFRAFEDKLLLGGAGHRTGENRAGGCYEILRKAAGTYYPDSRILAEWSAQDCMTMDEIPYIGSFSPDTPHLWVATGYKKWGMTTAMAAAGILTDAILEKQNPYADCFSPHRFHFTASMKNMVVDGFQAAKGLVKGMTDSFQDDIVEKKKVPPPGYFADVPEGFGGIMDYEDTRLGVYKSKQGETFVVSVKCPHLGCELAWNPDDLSWDCPCHGSRFDFQGRRIDGPAEKGILLARS